MSLLRAALATGEMSRTSEVWKLEAKKPSRASSRVSALVALPRQDLEARFHAVVAAPGHERFNFALLPSSKPNDLVEVRIGKVLRHHSDCRPAGVTNCNADRIAGKALQHLHARDRVAVLDVERAVDQAGRGKDVGVHCVLLTVMPAIGVQSTPFFERP
jgi:hypothetical protein